jgi:hypothetical protein
MKNVKLKKQYRPFTAEDFRKIKERFDNTPNVPVIPKEAPVMFYHWGSFVKTTNLVKRLFKK